jgi:CRISPR/Cas system CMR subunit Cmr4 (Cas7 group RAMP superfamily)
MASSADFSQHDHRRLARVVIEFTTPFHVGTGRGAKGIDALVVTDANGLPAIPGSSLAGALRAGFTAARQPETIIESLFGYRGCGARLSVSWACIHDQDGRPVEGIRASTASADPVVENARGQRLRDHVRLHHQGAAVFQGKFDEWPVCAGHRFTFELEFVSADCNEDRDVWAALLNLLRGGTLRLGGKTRRGFGAFQIVALHEAVLDLKTSDGFAAYRERPVSLACAALEPWHYKFAASLARPADPAATSTDSPPARTSPVSDALTITLRLTPVGYWMFGGGEDAQGLADRGKAPVRDDRIVWTSGKGAVLRDQLVLPGSSIKGALAHRVAWHWNKANKTFAAIDAPITDAKGWEKAHLLTATSTGENNPAVKDIFGFQKSTTDGRRGRMLIDDVFVDTTPPNPQPDQLAPHVTIDRVTGGAIANRLFTDRPLWRAPRPLVVALILLDAASSPISAASRTAFLSALADLCQGRLALGAGGGRGMGYFTGKVEWQGDFGEWAEAWTKLHPCTQEVLP